MAMQSIHLGDVDLAVDVVGSGPVLLLVHGFPLDHTMWAGQVEALSADYRIIAPDLRGFGASGVSDGAVTMELLADDLARLLDALRVSEPVTFCGLSMGGYVAWQFWRRHPGRLRSLVLCDTRAVADTPETVQARMDLAERVTREGVDFVAVAMLPKLFAPETHTAHPDLVDGVRAVIRKTDPRGIAAASRGMAERPDMTAALPDVDVPALLIVGEHDVISTAEEMRSMAAAMPRAELVEVPGAGHMAPLEKAELVNDALGRFLGR